MKSGTPSPSPAAPLTPCGDAPRLAPTVPAPGAQGDPPRESLVDPAYSGGEYFRDAQRHREDAEFKTRSLLRVLVPYLERNGVRLDSLVDVGCGSGDVVRLVAKALRERGHHLPVAKGYDVSPHVAGVRHEGVEYVRGDFCASDESVDLVTLCDVFEHIPDPIGFVRSVSQRCRLLCLHIPLDDSLNNALRDRFRAKLLHPGHLVFLDVVSALNLLASSGLRVVEYDYAFQFLAPSGHRSLLSKAVLPLRYLLARLNPWLASKLLGGASLVAIALTPRGLSSADRSRPAQP
jgi:SAM-dependent methyltransferase